MFVHIPLSNIGITVFLPERYQTGVTPKLPETAWPAFQPSAGIFTERITPLIVASTNWH
jgi:hypothetical protein